MLRLLALPAALAASLAPASAPAAPACSLAPAPMFRDGAHLIATATADTLPAGRGSMEYTLEPGEPERAVYGQVARAERLGGAQAAALPPGTERVVLVPWGYDAGCRRTLWAGSARWVPPGVRGLYWASLRPREEWVEGLPTLDVTTPYDLPYPEPFWRDPERADSALTVEQAFELLQILPLYDEYTADVEAATAPLLEWARRNPALARLHPARSMVGMAEHTLRDARLQRIQPPLAGTYRFTVSVDGDAPRTFFARTRSAPTTEWDTLNVAAYEDGPAVDDPIVGYTLLLAASTAADSLPLDRGRGREMDREGYISVLAAPEPEPGPGGAQIWRGAMELELAASALPADSALARAARAGWERYRRRSDAGEPVEVTGRFLLAADGSVRMEQTSVLDDGRAVVIRGERISRVTIPEPE